MFSLRTKINVISLKNGFKQWVGIQTDNAGRQYKVLTISQ